MPPHTSGAPAVAPVRARAEQYEPGTVKERLPLASCWRSPCLMRENFATPSADASSDAAVGFGAALCMPLGGILLIKASPWGLYGSLRRTRKVAFLKIEPTL